MLSPNGKKEIFCISRALRSKNDPHHPIEPVVPSEFYETSIQELRIRAESLLETHKDRHNRLVLEFQKVRDEGGLAAAQALPPQTPHVPDPTMQQSTSRPGPSSKVTPAPEKKSLGQNRGYDKPNPKGDMVDNRTRSPIDLAERALTRARENLVRASSSQRGKNCPDCHKWVHGRTDLCPQYGLVIVVWFSDRVTEASTRVCELRRGQQ